MESRSRDGLAAKGLIKPTDQDFHILQKITLIKTPTVSVATENKLLTPERLWGLLAFDRV